MNDKATTKTTKISLSPNMIESLRYLAGVNGAGYYLDSLRALVRKGLAKYEDFEIVINDAGTDYAKAKGWI